jgi:hypothetical protein
VAVVETMKSVLLRELQCALKFLFHEGPIERRVFVRAVTGMVLIHEIEIGVARYLPGQEGQHLFRTGDARR